MVRDGINLPTEPSSSIAPSGHNPCPLCSQAGREVPRKVLYQHLDAKGILEIFEWRDNWVCLQPDCACLYYSGRSWVPHQRCNKPVGFKNKEFPRLICYCFGYSDEEILKKASSGQDRSILDQIKQHLEKGDLLCQSTNPTGRSCLEMIGELLKKRPS